MAAVATEKWGRRLSKDEAMRLYYVTGASDAPDAKSAVESAAPATVDSGRLELDGVEVDEIPGKSSTFEAVAIYRSEQDKDAEDGDDPKFRFSSAGRPYRRYAFLSAPTDYPTGAGNSPDHKWSINARPDGTVEGVDINEPTFAWEETHYFATADVSEAYLGKLYALSWHTNDATFKIREGATATYAIGEVLFKYADGGQMGNGDWEITFHFEAAPNTTTLEVGDLTDITKAGQQYAWIEAEQRLDSGIDRIVVVPMAVHVGDVYPSGTFADLGLR